MAKAIVVPTGTGDTVAVTGSTQLHGFSVRESAVAPAVATIFIKDGTSAAGSLVAIVELAANGSETRLLPAVQINTGVFFETVAGESEGVLYVT